MDVVGFWKEYKLRYHAHYFGIIYIRVYVYYQICDITIIFINHNLFVSRGPQTDIPTHQTYHYDLWYYGQNSTEHILVNILIYYYTVVYLPTFGFV